MDSKPTNQELFANYQKANLDRIQANTAAMQDLRSKIASLKMRVAALAPAVKANLAPVLKANRTVSK